MPGERFDTIVVGSGVGGLTAALDLARRGSRVCVLEAMADFGGYLNPFRREQYQFDAGMHYLGQLGEGGVFRSLLQRLGVWDDVAFNEIDPDGFIRFVCGDFEISLPRGLENIYARFGDRFPSERLGIERFLSAVLKIDRAVESAAGIGAGAGAFFKALPHLPILLAVLSKTYFGLVSEHVQAPALRAALCMMNSGLPPQKASALIPALMFRHYFDGAYYPQGGSGALRDALVDGIRRAGGGLHNHTRVVRIRRDGAELVVESGSKTWRATSVVCNADPTLLYGELLDSALVHEKLRQRVENTVPSIGAFYAYVVTDLDLPSLGIGAATIQHYDSIETMTKVGRDPSAGFGHFLLSCTTLKDPEGGHAPPRQHILEIVAPAPFTPFAPWAELPSMRRGEEYVRFKEVLGRELIRKAERYVPGLGDHIRYVNFATPVTNLYWVNAPAGGCFGPAHLPTQVGRHRFATKSHVPGLFLCGHGTLAGGIYPSMRSGELAAAMATRYLGK